MLAFPLLGDLREPQAGASERGRLPRIGVHLANDQVPVRVVGVVVRDHDREVVFEAGRAQHAVGELELLAAGRGLTGRPRGGEVRIRVAQLPPAGGHARPLLEQRRIGDPSLHHPHAQLDVGLCGCEPCERGFELVDPQGRLFGRVARAVFGGDVDASDDRDAIWRNASSI